METIKEISGILRKKGAPYFDNMDIDLFIEEIASKYFSCIHYYNCISQEGESARLEFSFLTPKAVYDFTLVNKTIYTFIFFLKEITFVSEEISENVRSLKIQNGDDTALIYNAFSNSDKILLAEYGKMIVNEINKI